MNKLRVFRRGGNCDRNYSLTVVSISLGAPQKAQLVGWLLAWHVWPTCPKDLGMLRSSCHGRLVMGLI